MNKLLILGAGRVGKIIAQLATDFTVTFFDAFAAGLDFPTLSKTSLAELTPQDLAPFDVVLNCLPVSFNERVLPLVTGAQCSYLDLATDEVTVPEQLAYKNHFADRLMLANAGIAPGLDNILVAQLINRGATEINIYLIEHLFSTEAAPSWCVEDAVATLYDKPVSSVSGEIVRHNNFSDPETVATSQGDFVCYRFFGEEMLTLSRAFKAANISLKAGGAEVEAARKIFNNGAQHETVTSTAEPDGIFGIKIVSDAGEIELFLKPGHQLWQEGLPGNHISFHTAWVAYSMLQVALKHNLTGFYFPENLPDVLQLEILEQVQKQACFWQADW